MSHSGLLKQTGMWAPCAYTYWSLTRGAPKFLLGPWAGWGKRKHGVFLGRQEQVLPDEHMTAGVFVLSMQTRPRSGPRTQPRTLGRAARPRLREARPGRPPRRGRGASRPPAAPPRPRTEGRIYLPAPGPQSRARAPGGARAGPARGPRPLLPPRPAAKPSRPPRETAPPHQGSCLPAPSPARQPSERPGRQPAALTSLKNAAIEKPQLFLYRHQG